MLCCGLTHFDIESPAVNRPFLAISRCQIHEVPLSRKIEILPYSLEWQNKFKQEHKLLSGIIPNNLLIDIHHIGSTSITDLAAKPVIDMLMTVRDIAALDQFNADFVTLGYTPKGENFIAGRRFFQKGGDERTHHIHAFQANDVHVISHLAFRDYLRAFPDIKQQYQDIKHKAAQACHHDPLQYQALKQGFFDQHLETAIDWFKTVAS